MGNDKFSDEQKQELIAMYTGLALQGILANTGTNGLSTERVGEVAVNAAVAAVAALELHHMRVAAGGQ